MSAAGVVRRLIHGVFPRKGPTGPRPTPRRIAAEVLDKRGGVDAVWASLALNRGNILPILEEVAEKSLPVAHPDLCRESLEKVARAARKLRDEAEAALRRGEIPNPRIQGRLEGQAEAAKRIEQRIADIVRYYAGGRGA